MLVLVEKLGTTASETLIREDAILHIPIKPTTRKLIIWKKTTKYNKKSSC